MDFYELWGFASNTETVNLTSEQSDPPYARIFKSQNIQDTTDTTGNNSYALVAHSATRSSSTSSTDPWYFTNFVNSSQATYVVASGRPALSCWQQDTYRFRGGPPINLFNLGNVTELHLPYVWNLLLQTEYAAPKIVDTVESLSRSSLLSSTTFNSDGVTSVFDANSSSLAADMERLIWTAFVASANTFANTVLVTNQYGIPNAAVVNGIPGAGVGEFVVSTAAISTLDFNVLVGLPILMAILVVTMYSMRLDHWRRNRGRKESTD